MKVFLAAGVTDLRKSFDGLSGLASGALAGDPLSGHLFIFTSRRRDRAKLLYFERGGLAIWYKRLEEGTFATPKPAGDGKSVQRSADELALLLAGVDLAGVRRRKRYERAST